MDTLTNTAKRKKRKTRKCLDELRKRSLHITNDSVVKQSPIVSKVSKNTNLNGIKASNITSHRLTLAMFPKVIRSETITRPVPEISENSDINFVNILNGTNSECNTFQLSQPQTNSDSDSVEKSEEEYVDTATHIKRRRFSLQEDDSVNVSSQNNSPDSLVLLSPVDQTEDSDSFVVSPYATSSTTSTSSSQSSREGYGYHLYEEFMSEIPIYLKQNIPSLIKEDVIKKSKMFLHNIYLEGCRRECEDNILHCMRSGVLRNKCFTPVEPAVPSPLEYLRLAHVAHSLRPTPLAPERRALHDTPDYTYYPHKLNH